MTHTQKNRIRWMLIGSILAMAFSGQAFAGRLTDTSQPAKTTILNKPAQAGTARIVGQANIHVITQDIPVSKSEDANPTALSRIRTTGLTPHTADARKANIPLAPGKGDIQPLGGTYGTGGSYMSVSPEVVRPSTIVAVMSSGWTASETVSMYINGTFLTSFSAQTDGFLGVSLTAGATDGYFSVVEVGGTSGRIAGGAYRILTGATIVSGLAVAPHAVRHNGTDIFYMLAVQYAASTSINVAQNGTNLGTVTTTASGTAYLSLTEGTGADTSSVYTTNRTSIAASMAGASIEERADALTTATRAYPDRADRKSVV